MRKRSRSRMRRSNSSSRRCKQKVQMARSLVASRIHHGWRLRSRPIAKAPIFRRLAFER